MRHAWKLSPDLGEVVDGKLMAPRETVHGHQREDLAAMGVLHVLVQAKRGRLDKIPAAERWAFIRTMLWNRMCDEARRYSNKREWQSPTLHEDEDGTAVESDEALDLVAESHGQSNPFTVERPTKRNGVTRHPPAPISRRELRLIETMLDTALHKLPEAMLVKLHFGLCRNDEVNGEYDAPTFLEAMTLDDLAAVGYGSDRYAVRRRLDDALLRLRALLLADIERRKVSNFTA